MRDNTRRKFLSTAATTGLGLATFAGSAAADSAAASEIEIYDNFGYGIYGWTEGKDMPEGREAYIEHTNRGSASGWWGGCVKSYMDGGGDDGSVWLQTAVDVEPYTTYDVDLQVAGYNKQNSFNKLTAAHAILRDEVVRTEPDLLGRNDDSNAVHVEGDLQSANQEWKYYDDSGTYETGAESTAYLAFGTEIFWETEVENRLDDIYLNMTPR